MEVVETIPAMRAARAAFATIGLVPTMGFLHRGHLSLVARAKAECGACAVTIFVNPTQFAPSEDFGRYPRDLPRDLALLEEAGADIVFTPPPAEMYPPGFATSIDVGPVAQPLEGASRPGHFAGVATVVAKLFNIAQPTRAYFGQKDAQQAAVIRRLARDLDFPLEVVIASTVREADGLAMSSRNSYLSAEERASAAVLHRALSEAAARFAAGERDAGVLRAAMRAVLAGEPKAEVEYVSVADLATLEELQRIEAGALASLAVRIGRTRLIDNQMLGA
jgi:pantoate--beta-alanine ligase